MNANKNGLPSTGDDHIILFMHRDAVLVEMEIGSSLAVFPTLMRDAGKSSKELVFVACAERLEKGRAVMCLAVLQLPFAMLTLYMAGCRMGILAFH